MIQKNNQNKNYIENNLEKLNTQKINTLNFKILATKIGGKNYFIFIPEIKYQEQSGISIY